MSVVAIRPINPGEEIVTSYVDLALTKELRQEELKERYKFDCACDECKRSQGVDPREALSCRKAKEGCRGLIALPGPSHTPALPPPRILTISSPCRSRLTRVDRHLSGLQDNWTLQGCLRRS